MVEFTELWRSYQILSKLQFANEFRHRDTSMQTAAAVSSGARALYFMHVSEINAECQGAPRPQLEFWSCFSARTRVNSVPVAVTVVGGCDNPGPVPGSCDQI